MLDYGIAFLSWYLLFNQTKKKWQGLFFVLKIFRHLKDLCALSIIFGKKKHCIWYSIKFTLNNAKKCPYQRQINMLSPRFRDVLSARLRTNLPAGHSMQLLASVEALTNHPSEHGSNLYSPRLWLANPDCLKAGSSWNLPSILEMSIYSESSCPKPLKWKIRKKRLSNGYLGLTIKKK